MATTNDNKLPVTQKDISDDVLKRINVFRDTGELRFPKNYSPENAIKSAMLILQETKTKREDGFPVLEYCTRDSIANSLLAMVIWGLSPMKKQCDFIAYGKKLILQREYHGTVALAKRLGGVKETNANIIYEGDVFKYGVDINTGKIKILEHKQEFKNIDNSKILGAYAVLTFEDKENDPYVEIMNMNQIRHAWAMGATKGQSPAHINFPDEMARKTVIGRACKLFISSSDDSNLALAERYSGKKEHDVEDIDAEEMEVQKEIEENANKEEMDFEKELVADSKKIESGEQTNNQNPSQFIPGF